MKLIGSQDQASGALPIVAGEAAAGSSLVPFLGEVNVTVRRSVFHERVEHHRLPALGSIAEVVDGLDLGDTEGLDVACWLNGQRLPSRYWRRVRPKGGAIVGIALLPRDGRTALLIGGALALAVTAGFAGPLVAGGLAGALGSTGAGLAGGLVAGGIPLGGALMLNA